MSLLSDPHLAWTAELDRLEHSLHQVELHEHDGLTGDFDPEPSPPWEAPRDLGPIPPSLLPRARDLLARQRQVEVTLAEALDRVSRQQRYTARVTQAVGAVQQPAYLDITA